MGQLIQDLRHGARVLLRKPAFAATAVVTLALGIGANAAIFSVVYGVLLHPLPYRAPERVVTVWETDTRQPEQRLFVSPASFLAWRERAGAAFESVAASSPWAVDYTGGDEPESLDATLVSEGYFETLGVVARLGRTFRPEEHKDGALKVVLLSHAAWQQKFGGDASLVGRTLAFGQNSYQVVGILPPDFRAPGYGASVYAPIVFWPGAEQSRAQYMRVVARLKAGVELRGAQAALDAVVAQLASERSQQKSPLGSVLLPVLDQIVGPVRPALVALFGSAILILLIACANVAHLQMARASERQREFAIRAALGAERSRLLRQLVTESVWLVGVAAAAGVCLAYWGVRAMRALAPANIPRLDLVGLNAPVFAFGASLALVTLLLFSLGPALRTARGSLLPSLKEGGATSAGRGTHRLRSSLVVWQVALALVLLVGASLLLRSFVSLLRVDPGFRAEGVASLQVFVYNRYPKPEQQAEYFRQALSELRATPGVRAAGVVSVQPFLFGAAQMRAVVADDQPPPAPGQEATAGSLIAAGDYFRAAGIPVLRGRVFGDDASRDGVPVAVVSEALARRLWGAADPIGRTFTLRGSEGGAVRLSVVGVVGDVRNSGLSEPPQPSFYRPLAQAPTGGMAFVVRTDAPVTPRVPEIKQAIWRVNRTQPFYRVSTVEELVARSLTQRRFLLYLIATFASLALVLATVGIYGVISFVTSQRGREIGLRIALGATSGGIVRMVMGQGLGLAGAGAALGWLAAFALSRSVSGLLYGVSPLDPLAYGATAALLLAVAAAASYLPARRALRNDPVAALRPE